MHVLRSERLGTLWFALAVLGSLGVEGWRRTHSAPPDDLNVGQLLMALDSMEGADAPDEGATGFLRGKADAAGSGPEFPAVKAPIRPKDLDSAGWVALGLSPRQARGAQRYVRSIGGQVSRAALERMRVLPDGWLSHYGPSLVLDSKKVGEDTVGAEPWGRSRKHPNRKGAAGRVGNLPTFSTDLPIPTDINRADSMELLAIRGVGPWVAGRILNARRRWGGFADLSLLTEALNGWDSLATALHPSFQCSAADVQRRCPDSLDVPGWAALPKVGWKEARVLERRAKHHGPDVDRVLDHPALDSTSRVIIARYLRPCKANG